MSERKVLKKPNFHDFRLASNVVHRQALHMNADGIRLPYTRTRIIFCSYTCKINHKIIFIYYNVLENRFIQNNLNLVRINTYSIH